MVSEKLPTDNGDNKPFDHTKMSREMVQALTGVVAGMHIVGELFKDGVDDEGDGDPMTFVAHLEALRDEMALTTAVLVGEIRNRIVEVYKAENPDDELGVDGGTSDALEAMRRMFGG